MVGLIMNNDIEYNEKNRMAIALLQEIIDIKLVEVIREKMSGVYSPQASISIEKYPKSECAVFVMFGCNPKQANKLTKAVFKIMNDLKKKGPSIADLEKAKETVIRERETNIKKNNYWLSKIESAYFNGEDLNQILNFEEKIKSFNQTDIANISKICFNENNFVRVVLYPEKGK
jgi:zinc protease